MAARTSSSLKAARLLSPWTLASRAYMSRPWRCFHRVDPDDEDDALFAVHGCVHLVSAAMLCCCATRGHTLTLTR